MEKENIIEEGDASVFQSTFDNLFILREFSNISSSLSDEEFLATVPKEKIESVRWISVFRCIKQDILDMMVREMNKMWTTEDMRQKLEILETQREKYAEIHPHNSAWRPQHDSVKNQLRALDAGILRNQKALLESLLNEYDEKVNKLQKTVQAKRQYLKAVTMDIQKYEKNVEEVMSKICEKIQTHSALGEEIIPKFDNDVWLSKTQKDVE
ncbi:uncharacterized protein LOC123712707 [Pieris brassicae]|uniref:Uncharacterized protein n=1 Tax=Pieris brassicae TaxID=7116 RepID=A0A9P0TSM3_PIEBR|nr:uncharacterized protein LOC123712707 [Pieris brassicae]CAH4034627.1 unnamed protein product [Pieris brassicae]